MLEARAEGRVQEEEQMDKGDKRSIKLMDVILCSLEHRTKTYPNLCPGVDGDRQDGTLLTALKWEWEQRKRAAWLCQLCAVRGRASWPFAPMCQGQSSSSSYRPTNPIPWTRWVEQQVSQSSRS